MAKSTIPYRGLKPENTDDNVWYAVVDGWSNGLSDRDCAFRASKLSDVRITEADIKSWFKANPDIAELKEFLAESLVSDSKLIVADAIRSGDVKTAKWYLEKKKADEFGSKASVSFENAVVELSLADKEKALNEMMERFENEQ